MDEPLLAYLANLTSRGTRSHLWLKYIGSRAFLDCTALRRLVKMPGTRRGVYAEENAFAICPAMKWPPWLHMIPDMGYTPGSR